MSGRQSTAIALLSGGLDSVVAAALWLETGAAIALALTFDYGQRAVADELAAAEAFARGRRVPWRAVPLPFLRELAEVSGCALVAAERPLPAGTAAAPGDERSAAAVWVPARNAVFVAIGAAHADALGADVVLAGFNREEAATFPDNSPAFVAAASELLARGCRAPVRVASPTLELDKPGIAAAARRLGIRRADVWSCYRGGPVPCGSCESCARSERAWGAP